MKNYVEAFTKPKEYCIEQLQKPLALSAISTLFFANKFYHNNSL